MKKSTQTPSKPVKATRTPARAALAAEEAMSAADADIDAEGDDAASEARIVARPDGYHWIAPDGRQEFGPFETLEEAQADMAEGGENQTAHGALLNAAEADIGQTDWVDPETGDLAEGYCPPHLDDD